MISLNSEQNASKIDRLRAQLRKKKVVAAALSSYGKWEDTDGDLDFEGELPAPNSFCRRSFFLCSSRATQIEAEVMYSSRCPFVLKSLL